MVEVSIILVVNALFCAGLHIITRYETKMIKYNSKDGQKSLLLEDFDASSSMVLGYVGYVVETFLPPFIHKPVVSCLTCMSSLWGLVFLFAYWCSMGNPERTIFIIGAPVYVIALAGLNTLIDRKLNEL